MRIVASPDDPVLCPLYLEPINSFPLFKRLLLVSGLLSIIATGVIYYTAILPDVDVLPLPSAHTLALDDTAAPAISTGQIVTVQGHALRMGRTLLGKTEMFLTDSSGRKMVFCAFAIGHPAQLPAQGDTVTVKGVWKQVPGAVVDTVPVVLGMIEDGVSLR